MATDRNSFHGLGNWHNKIRLVALVTTTAGGQSPHCLLGGGMVYIPCSNI